MRSTRGKFFKWNLSPSDNGPFPSYAVRGQALLNDVTEGLNMAGLWYTVAPEGGGDYAISVGHEHEAQLRSIVEHATVDDVSTASVWMFSVLIDTRKNPDTKNPSCLSDVMSSWLSDNSDFKEQILDWAYPKGTVDTMSYEQMPVYSIHLAPFIQVTVQMLVDGDKFGSITTVADLCKAMSDSDDGIVNIENWHLRNIQHNPYTYTAGDAFSA